VTILFPQNLDFIPIDFKIDGFPASTAWQDYLLNHLLLQVDKNSQNWNG